MSSRLYNMAVNAANEAAKCDSEGNKEQAISKYLQAFDLLTSIIRHTDNKKLKDFYATRAEQYLSRAYALKTASGKPAQSAAQQSPADDAEDTQEKEQLQAKVASMILPEKPNVSWNDIAGLQTAKEAIEDAIILPLRRVDLFKGMPTWKGILLFGPPGCGKTLLAKAAASECEATFFSVSAADVMVKWVGDSEQRVKALFEAARKNQPAIVFIDEVDSLGMNRSGEESAVSTRVLTQMLQMMDGVQGKPDDRVVVLGATNRPWNLDSAMLRRFDKRILVTLPDAAAREEMFKITIQKMPSFKVASDVNMHRLAQLTQGLSGDDIKKLCIDAWYRPIHELKQQNNLESGTPRPVTEQDFTEALKTRRASVSTNEVTLNEQWAQQYGMN
ncbi:MAG: ATP-binding protein [Candidatus Bathyarchaeota archaeon]|nr:ATP-binding protein [Candidatus Bathyarchaeota archaeon]